MRSQSFCLAASMLAALAAAMPAVTTLDERSLPSQIEAREPQPSGPNDGPSYDHPTNQYCNNFPEASVQQAYQVMSAFFEQTQHRGGQYCLGAGPGACNVVTSKDGAEVWMCNDNRYNKCVDYEDIYYRGNALFDTCSPPSENSPWSGQVFFGDNTNLIMRAG